MTTSFKARLNNKKVRQAITIHIFHVNRKPSINRGPIKSMADKLMCIPNDDTQNYHFCRLQLVDETFEHSTI